MAKLTLIGGGAMARAVARILVKSGVDVHVYARNTTLVEEVEGVVMHDEMGPAVEGASVVFLAVPADSLLEASEQYGEFARGDHVVLTATRGVTDRFMLPHEMIRAMTCVRKIGYLGGPIHARELTTGRQINLVLASRYGEVVNGIRALIQGTPIALHRSADIVGVQVAGAIANVGSIASGIATALDFGDTARGVLLTHGLVDATRLGVALGASASTFSGLAGVGELIPRHVTSMDRHVDLGRRVAEGEKLASALVACDGHVEGVKTAEEAVKAADRLGLELLLVPAVHDILLGRADPREALEAVLHKSLDLDHAINS
ncbi:MAG: NAD(P)-binding domain-containing protein [Deltaproteobacteria bacterium]